MSGNIIFHKKNNFVHRISYIYIGSFKGNDNNVDKQCRVLFAFSTTRWWGAVKKELDLDFTYVSLMTRILFRLSPFLLFLPLSLTDENSATDCSPVQRSFATSNELGVRFPCKCDSSFKQAIEFASTTFRRFVR